jgi:N-acetylmuramoyl-L-alanine amidase
VRPSPERYKEIQQALADKGFYDGPINGVWGEECVAALKRFQEGEDLVVDGKLGARSIIALGLGPQRSADSQFLVKPPADTEDEP